jgi:hypothetical protein
MRDCGRETEGRLAVPLLCAIVSRVEQIIVDLGDFIPEEYVVRFSIEGRKYEVRYKEARVDEVLQVLLDAAKDQPLEDQIAARRRTVTQLFTKNLSVGDPAQLEADLTLLPYTSFKGGLDIFSLYLQVQSRTKKKDPGAPARKTPTGLRGFLASLLS